MTIPSILQSFTIQSPSFASAASASAGTNVTAGNLLLVFATDGGNNGNGSNIPTDTRSTSYTTLANAESGSVRVRLFGGILQSSGTCLVSSTWSGGNNNPTLFVVEVKDALLTPHAIASFADVGLGSVSDFTTAGLTTTNPNTLIITVASADRTGAGPYTAGSGYTILNASVAGGLVGAEYKTLTSTISNVQQHITASGSSVPSYSIISIALVSPFINTINFKSSGGFNMRSAPGKYPIRIR